MTFFCRLLISTNVKFLFIDASFRTDQNRPLNIIFQDATNRRLNALSVSDRSEDSTAIPSELLDTAKEKKSDIYRARRMLMSMLMLLWRREHCWLSRLCIETVIQSGFLPSVSGSHTCCECQKTYKSRMALNRHVREECGRILYTCPYCRNIMPMKFNLLNHLKKEHGC